MLIRERKTCLISWHIYNPDVAPLLPNGAVLVLKQWYDNTSDNPNVTDPDQFVVWGSRTADEMNHAWIAVTHLDDEGFERLTEERKEKELRSVVVLTKPLYSLKRIAITKTDGDFFLSVFFIRISSSMGT